MKKYLVWWAVRDKLLNREIKDKDYVVVWSTVEEMLELWFIKVWADFPVFLHPKTKEEYALARTEIKNGVWYNWFKTFFSKETTLEDDLKRRDLTINSIAFDEEKNIFIDPFGWIKDLENKILKHTSEAFSDDPLRVLRLARFYARYEDFEIDFSTKEFCKKLIPEIKFLKVERIFQEIEKVFTENKPSRFFYFLEEIWVLKEFMKELSDLKDVPQPVLHHPEICSFKHSMMVLDKWRELLKEKKFTKEEKTAFLFSALLHDLWKWITPKELLPSHIWHEKAWVPLVENICKRLKVPFFVKKLSTLFCEDHMKIHKILEVNSKTLLKFYKRWDYKRKPIFTEMMVLLAEADAKWRLTFENREYPQKDFLEKIFFWLKNLDLSEIINKNKENIPKMKNEIHKKELEFIKKFRENYFLENKF